MADFNSHIITNAGRNLLARALAGEGKVLFTKAAFGDQKHSGNLREVTELKNKKLDLNVMNIRNDNGTAVLTVQISNQNVDQSFQTEEFGVYAKIEGDATEILYSYTTAVSADTFPNNRLGKTYESIQEIYMAISNDVEAEIYVRDGVIYLTRDIANQVYTETGLTAVGTLKGRNNLEADKQYLAENGHWYKNIGGSRSWNSSTGTPDEQLIPITWEYLYKSLNTKENQLVQNLNGILGQNNGEFPVEQAVAGNVYYFPRNQKFYYCLKSQTSRVSVPNADFEELSIYQNRKKLENLSSSGSKKIELNIPNSSYSYAYRIGDICILNIDSGSAFVGKKANDILFKLPSNLYPKTRTIATLGSFVPRLSREIVVYIEPNGDCVLKTQDAVCQTAYYGNISYIVQN
ncbi:hypothetical protein [Fusobacterium hwasookii]|uniref:hypothetical protein n=1 Tax=Fusobacterium hwasookii TaxID=1583098 RepID=UPI00071AEAC8|nr:hypothetical protein [Fusobacterium hwasookii]ALQ36924.1 hypothetical protein RN97_01585 [Fusobacterium hwasookii ChDC F300]